MNSETGAQSSLSGGWSIRSRIDDSGRTLYSIYIGDRLVVRDALSTDGAVIAARQWVQSRRDSGRGGTNVAGERGLAGRTKGAAR